MCFQLVCEFQFLEEIAWGIVCHAVIECHHAILEPVGALLAVQVDGGEYRAIVFVRLCLDNLIGIEARVHEWLPLLGFRLVNDLNGLVRIEIDDDITWFKFIYAAK